MQIHVKLNEPLKKKNTYPGLKCSICLKMLCRFSTKSELRKGKALRHHCLVQFARPWKLGTEHICTYMVESGQIEFQVTQITSQSVSHSIS